MENYSRSQSCRDGRMQLESYYKGGGGRPTTAGPIGMHDLRSYSTSHGPPLSSSSSSSSVQAQQKQNQNQNQNTGLQRGKDQLKKMKKFGNSKTVNGSASNSWILTDPELQRKKRVAGYKVYSVEGKMKGSLRKSFKWVKDAYTQLVYGSSH